MVDPTGRGLVEKFRIDVSEYARASGFGLQSAVERVTMNFLCRMGVHRLVDFPDPNPESGGLEKQGYRACTRCPKEKDANVYRSVMITFRLPSA